MNLKTKKRTFQLMLIIAGATAMIWSYENERYVSCFMFYLAECFGLFAVWSWRNV